MQSHSGVYEKMLNCYNMVLPYSFKNFIKDTGLEELENEFKKNLEMNIFFKYIGKHYKQNKAQYLAEGYINPYDFSSTTNLKKVFYVDETITMFVEYQELEFIFYYSFADGEAQVYMIHDDKVDYPYALHPDTHTLFEGLTKIWALDIFDGFNDQKEKKTI